MESPIEAYYTISLLLSRVPGGSAYANVAGSAVLVAISELGRWVERGAAFARSLPPA